MADISELLGEQNPEQLQKLLALRDNLTPNASGQISPSLPMGVATDAAASPPASLDDRIAQNQKMLSLMDNSPTQHDAETQGPLPLPNGGMEGPALDDYLKTHGGPVANIGFNPSAADNPKPKAPEAKEEDDSEDDGDSSRGPAGLLNKLQSLRSNPTKNPPPIQDTLSKLLGQNNDELANARDQRGQMQLLAMLGLAGQQAGAALSPLGNVKTDPTAFNALMAASQQPVGDIKNKQDINNEILKGSVLKGQAQTEIQKTDPNSAVSQAYRDLYEKTTHKKADPGMSAMDIEKLEPMLARMSTAEENSKNRANALAVARGTKELDKKDKADTHVGDMLESSRQTKDVSQAYLDSYSASKALKLLKKYPDMNAMTPQETSLITSEVAKIAQGGVPGKEELKALKVNALPSWFASEAQKLTNNPIPAQAGKFMQKYKDYLEELQNNAKEVINDKITRVIDTHEGRMNPSTAKLYREKYVKPLEDSSKATKAHPQDKEAIEWAKANPDNPMSAQILQANGVQ